MYEFGVEFLIIDHISDDLMKSWLKTAENVTFTYNISSKSFKRKLLPNKATFLKIFLNLHIDITQPLVSQSDITKRLVSQSDISKRLVSQSDISKRLVSQSDIRKRLVSQSDISKRLVSQSDTHFQSWLAFLFDFT